MKYRYYLLFLVFLFFSSCYTYPKQYPIESRDNLQVFNKRGQKQYIDIKNFIEPQKTKSILTHLQQGETKNYSLLKKLTHYVKSLPYSEDQADFWNYVEETLQYGGDCEDKAHLLASLLIEAGFNNVYVIKGEIKKGLLHKRKGHLWIEISLADKKYILETVPRQESIQEKAKTFGYSPFFQYNNKESFFYVE
jgi:hypothetical protein